MFSLEGKVALVTGAASGIGAATATRFARAGADVALGWYSGDPHDIEQTRRAVEATGRRALVLEGDVSKTADVERIVRSAIGELGGLHIVLANAAIARDVPSQDLDDDRWNALLDVNLLGVFRCFRAALPHLTAQRQGRLLATSSIAGGVQGWARHVHYCASKGGVVGLVRGLALEVAPHGITVNAIAPGVIYTPLHERTNTPEALEKLRQAIPLGRLGRPEDVAGCVAFLASEDAAYITGEIIAVNGGLRMD